MPNAKPWWKSWTIHLNTLALIAIALEIIGDPIIGAFIQQYVTPEQFAMIVAVLNLLLRVKTKGPVTS